MKRVLALSTPMLWVALCAMACSSEENPGGNDEAAAGAASTAGTPAVPDPVGTTGGSGGTTSTTSGTSGASGTAAGAGATAGAGGSAAGAGGMAAAGVGGSTVAGTGGAGGSVAIPTEPFSFFVTSLVALQALSGNDQGFGGDLSYGETGEGAGLRGADKLCTEIAERSMPGAGAKGWRAFLSAVAAGPGGTPVGAIDRIGEGPWYDRLGRVFANSKSELLAFRPTATDPAIVNNLPNEDGVPNKDPDGTGDVDNHDTLTGSNDQGQVYAMDMHVTCNDWTNAVPDAADAPRVGHSWPRNADGMMGGGLFGGGDPGGPGGSYGHWISSLTEAGCGAGVFVEENGGPREENPTVGSGGGYGGFYCFALMP
jgi:hypothetical protein